MEYKFFRTVELVKKEKKNIIKHLILIIIIFLAYSGCNKKENNVINETCEIKCLQIPEVGPCNAAIPIYYFDSKTKKCEIFIWGGCAGVVPFDTMEECLACDCK